MRANRSLKASRRAETRKATAVIAGGGVVIALALTLAITPLLDRPSPPSTPSAQTVVISMAGFSPSVLKVQVGRPITLTIVNPDSQFHADGGGWHQFAIDAIDIDVRVAPRSQQTVSLGPLAVGRYEFYCDVCCGGRANPSMIGILEVTG